MKRRRLELPRHNCHYPLKVARLPIPPPLHFFSKSHSSAQNRTRTCTTLLSLVPETSASTIPPPGLSRLFCSNKLSGKRDSDPRPQPWQGCALPTELLPHYLRFLSNAVQRYNIFWKDKVLPRKKCFSENIFSGKGPTISRKFFCLLMLTINTHEHNLSR